jgi:hypothetical protein
MRQKGKPDGLPFFAVACFDLDGEWKSVLYPKALHVDAQGPLNLAEITLFFRRGKRGGDATAGSAASAAYTMHKIFRDLGHVVVHDVRHVVYVNTAGGNIGSYQNAMTTLGKAA